MKQDQFAGAASFRIDNRSSADVYKQAVALLERYCDGLYSSADIANNTQLELVLLRLFSDLTINVSTWVNKIPQHQQYALLKLLGAALRPPQPAETLLTFTIRKNNTTALVPDGTQVAYAKDSQIIFETSNDLVVNNTPILTAYSTNYAQNSYMDLTEVIVEGERGFNILGSNSESDDINQTPRQHFDYALYLSSPDFDFSTPINLKLKFMFPEDSQISTDYFDKLFEVVVSDSQRFSSYTLTQEPKHLVRLPARLPFDAWPLTMCMEITDLVMKPTKINDIEAFWLKVVPRDEDIDLTTVDTEIAQVVYEIAAKNCAFDAVFVNDVNTQVEKGFYLFGNNPQEMDTIYIGSKRAFTNGSAWQIGMDYLPGIVADYANKPKEGIVLVWEYWNGTKWLVFAPAVIPEKPAKPDPTSSPDTFSTKSKRQTKNPHYLTLSYTFWDIGVSTINQVESRWIRCRIAEGSYGEKYGIEPIRQEDTDKLTKEFDEILDEAATGWADGSDNGAKVLADDLNKEWALLPFRNLISNMSKKVIGGLGDKIKKYLEKYYTWGEISGVLEDDDYVVAQKADCYPPYINLMTLSCEIAQRKTEGGVLVQRPIRLCQTFNQFQYQIFDGAKPFKPYLQQEKAAYLYLAFDSNVAGMAWNAYFLIQIAAEKHNEGSNAVVWEYKNAAYKSRSNAAGQDEDEDDGNGENDDKEWLPLVPSLDETDVFTKSGFVNWDFPGDIAPCLEFGEEFCWVRCSLEQDLQSGIYFEGIYPNSVMAENVVTLQDHLLGSSNGTQGQHFSLAGGDIYEGEVIEVKELFLKNSAQTSYSMNDDPALQQQGNEIEERWIAWNVVNSFAGSDSNSRDYTINRRTGTITFGNGEQGRIPPLAENNIRASMYKKGAVITEDIDRNQINKLLKNIEGISAVTNPVQVSGGAGGESAQTLAEEYPKEMAYHGVIVTRKDFEVATKEASTKVARAHAEVNNGKVTVYILPKEDTGGRYPSFSLIRSITGYLENRASVELVAEGAIEVVAPDYANIKVAYSYIKEAQYSDKMVESNIEERLLLYFDPIGGRASGEGWNFGETAYLSEVEEFMGDIEGVQSVVVKSIARTLLNVSAEKDRASGKKVKSKTKTNKTTITQKKQPRQPLAPAKGKAGDVELPRPDSDSFMIVFQQNELPGVLGFLADPN